MDGFRKLVTDRLRAQSIGASARDEEHPSADILSAYAEQALSGVERTQVMQHLGICRNCRETLYLALPSSTETQKVFAVQGRASRGFALRWGTLAAAIAVGAIVLVSTRHPDDSRRDQPAQLAKSKTAVTAAELKTPPAIAEIRAAHDARDTAAQQKQSDKIIPTPKHMTAKPAANFDIDQSDQVRVATAPGAALQANSDAGASAAAKVVSPVTSGLQASSAAVGVSAAEAQTDGEIMAYSSASNQFDRTVSAHGALSGTITDASGAVIPRATITVNGPAGTRAMQSDPRGRFEFDQLKPGPYSVEAQAPGFEKTGQQIAVLDRPANVRMALQVGSASETVEVVGAAAQLQTNGQLAPPQPLRAERSANVQAESAPVTQNARSRRQAEVDTSENAALKKAAAPFSPAVLPQWMLAADGSVQRSLDSGNTWSIVPVSGSNTFRSLSATGPEIWVGGNAGALYHSADSGRTWIRVVPSAAGRRLQSDITRVEFFDASNGTVVCSNGESWSTSDGGGRWSVK